MRSAQRSPAALVAAVTSFVAAGGEDAAGGLVALVSFASFARDAVAPPFVFVSERADTAYFGRRPGLGGPPRTASTSVTGTRHE
ncbi:MAG TPA: hypothetical protein VFN74_22725 [Chloroflexota bacterium]|nr:hypothetical protein [Chloroflexota bacterium]